jgi:hypothetical protein
MIFFVDYNQTSLKPFVDVFARFVQRSQMSKQDDILAKSGSFIQIIILLLFLVYLFFRSKYNVIRGNLIKKSDIFFFFFVLYLLSDIKNKIILRKYF